jgi:hypothetical protein
MITIARHVLDGQGKHAGLQGASMGEKPGAFCPIPHQRKLSYFTLIAGSFALGVAHKSFIHQSPRGSEISGLDLR